MLDDILKQTSESLNKWIKMGDQNVQIAGFEDHKYEDSPLSDSSDEMRKIFGGIKLMQPNSSSLSYGSSESDSDDGEDDGMYFSTKSFKMMSTEERKDFLDQRHKNYTN